MKPLFKPNGLPTLIGSLPVATHAEAARLVLTHTPEIPLWAQLPGNRIEGMMLQFLPGLPGLSESDDKTVIDTTIDTFEADLLDNLRIKRNGAHCA